jgi:hypothetical protein
MNKMLFVLILINFVVINQVNNEQVSSINSRSWLYPCSEGECLNSIDKCVEEKCAGEIKCIDCVTKDRYACKTCIHEIFNGLNLVNGDLICSVDDKLQEKVCQMYCQGLTLNNKGKCERNQKQIPRCLCQDDEEMTTTIETDKETECK